MMSFLHKCDSICIGAVFFSWRLGSRAVQIFVWFKAWFLSCEILNSNIVTAYIYVCWCDIFVNWRLGSSAAQFFVWIKAWFMSYAILLWTRATPHLLAPFCIHSACLHPQWSAPVAFTLYILIKKWRNATLFVSISSCWLRWHRFHLFMCFVVLISV